MFPKRSPPQLGLLSPLLVPAALDVQPDKTKGAKPPKPFVVLPEGKTATVHQHAHVGPGKEFYRDGAGQVQWVQQNQHVFLRAQKPASRPPVPPKTPIYGSPMSPHPFFADIMTPVASPLRQKAHIGTPYPKFAKHVPTPYPHVPIRVKDEKKSQVSDISLPDLSKLVLDDDSDDSFLVKETKGKTLFRAQESTKLKAEDDEDGLMSFKSALTTLQPPEEAVVSKANTTQAPLRPFKLVDLPIIDVFGSGGFGIVYKSRLPGSMQEVAVKRFKGGRTFSDEKEAFDQELAAFEKIGDHPNCVTLYGYVIEPEHRTIALVLELARKGSLSTFMSDDTKAAEIRGRKFLPILRQIVEGLVHLHDRELAHRDIKPDNVLVFQTGTNPLVKLSDFGLLREQHRNSTRLRTFAGTPFYSAPEIDWSRKGPRASILPYQQPLKVNYYAADIWALGIMMAEICSAGLVNEDLARLSQAARTSKAALRVVARDLMGHPMAEATMAKQTIAKGPAPTPSGRTPAHRLRPNAQCPLWVTELIEACLARRPKDRPTARQILTILKKHEHDYN